MSRRPAQRKWGIRTCGSSGWPRPPSSCPTDADDRHNTDVILLTFIGLLVGLVGATISTIQGFRAWGGRLPGEEPPPDRRQRP